MLRKRQGKIPCLLVGDLEHEEFVPAVNWLRQQVQLTCRPTPQIASAAAATSPSFELIVLTQARPGQISTADVESLHQLWPLAKLVGLLGGWCEGEGRSGRPWPGVWRVRACDFPWRLRQLFDVAVVSRSASLNHDAERRSTSSRPRSWLLPRLITDAERFYYDAAEPLVAGTGSVLIAAANREAFEPIADAVRQAGCRAIWHRSNTLEPTSTLTAAIWDASRTDAVEWDQACEFAATVAPAPLVILAGFPRNDDHQRAAALSVRVAGRENRIAVMAKPLVLADLSARIVGMTGTTVMRHALDTPSSDHKDSQVITPVTEYY